MFLSVRERSYLYYILYMVSYLAFIVTERIQGLTLFDEIPSMFHKQYLTYYLWAGWFFALLMARSFLDTKNSEPKLDKLIKLFLKINVVSFILTIFVDPVVAIQWGVVNTLFYAVFVSWVAFKVMMKGNPAARFYCIAWILNFCGAGVYGLTVGGYLPFNFITKSR